MAELKRSMILERTAAGRAAAKASGKSLDGGSRRWTDRDARKAAGLVKDHGLSTRQAAGAMGDLYRMLTRARELDGDNGAMRTEVKV